jgi:hypothetical protein
LVTYEARGAGAVLMVSDAAGAMCEHLKDGMIHAAGDVAELTGQFDVVNRDRNLLRELRGNSLAGLTELTWGAAGRCLADLYRGVIASRRLNPSN